MSKHIEAVNSVFSFRFLLFPAVFSSVQVLFPGVNLHFALCLGRLCRFFRRRAADTVGKFMFPHGNCAVSEELVVDSAPAVFLLCAEKQLSLLAQMQNVRSGARHRYRARP